MSATVRDLGEFALIAALQAALPESVTSGPPLELGIGDDAAAWMPAERSSLVITTDTLVEDVHFRLDWTDWRSLGHKLLAVNLSDLAAMGASPRVAVITLGLRGDERVDNLIEMYRGVGALAARFGVKIAGGDVVESPRAVTIHATALGESAPGRYLSRGGAKPGDAIAVSGTLGAAAAGLRLLQEGGDRLRAATADQLVAAQLRPEPRVALGRVLIEHGASAAMDLSDGLFGDLPKILEASGVAAVVEHARVPVAAAIRALFPDAWFDLATRGGEDYELLFTASPSAWDGIERAAAAAGSTLTRIGEIVARDDQPPLRLRASDGTIFLLPTGAYDHFR